MEANNKLQYKKLFLKPIYIYTSSYIYIYIYIYIQVVQKVPGQV